MVLTLYAAAVGNDMMMIDDDAIERCDIRTSRQTLSDAVTSVGDW